MRSVAYILMFSSAALACVALVTVAKAMGLVDAL